ncbi:uncharacterized protein LOC132031289 isoform X2 [Lycium ferocissimum]|uniref:uncharacterized protein LOC132031289 isoform X2 n=1 Tax=Lycium ferocissimum TaxID=112874 RepID=UPI0028166280|nr:uncharacterized protein LOC132031289 isoform X2 [Lycium ferocissimum]
MDAYEATKIVFQRIQNLDPENASKIMGILLIQDHDVEWKICYQIYLPGKQMVVAESENALRKYAPDGESEIQVRDVCCATGSGDASFTLSYWKRIQSSYGRIFS